MKFDFSGYATKNDLKCTDGVTIRQGAFKECDGNIVPLVWQHLHDDPSNVLGKAFLQHRNDGVYAYCSFNNTERAQNTKELLAHGDINSMSIYATKVVKRGNNVVHGDIKEVSLVLAPANPGAVIENLSFQHSDGTYEPVDDEMIIRHSGEVDEFEEFDLPIDLYDSNGDLAHSDDDMDDDEDDYGDEDNDDISHADDEDDDGETVEDVFNTLNEKQKKVVYAMIGAALSENESDDTIEQSDEGGDIMAFNAFEHTKGIQTEETLSHSEITAIANMVFDECQNQKVNFKDALKHAAAEYGIENISILFPDAKTVINQPEFVKRRTEWVNTVLSGTKHSPFSRIKNVFADITEDEARARGYLKGNKKMTEVFPVMSRTTGPQTIYKLQKLDRDDILDITDFDVVAWLRAEMRVMLDEELARAILIGDGRLVTSPDKIKEDCIRPIWTDDDFYSYKQQLAGSKAGNLDELADAFIRSRLNYEGSGRPVTFMAPETVTELMLQRDKEGKRMYKTEQELADALRVSRIIEVPLFYNQTRTDKNSKKWALNAIIVNLADYTVGADRGGEVTNFDDFDIDYNQYKYLIETRCSGALTGYHSAVVIETEVTTPTPPSPDTDTQASTLSARSRS